MMKEFNRKKKLLEKICGFYYYELTFTEESVICKGCEKTLTYKNIDEALIDWVDTLIDTDEESLLNDNGAFWSKEIEYIKEIENNKLSD